MSETYDSVECGEHGRRRAAFVCKHLAAGEKAGFNWGIDPDDPHALCPDAWCDRCESVLEQQGEWNDAASSFAGITLICADCYVDIREKNWIEDHEEFDRLAEQFYERLRDSQTRLWHDYQIEKWERWDWSLDTQQLVFSHQGLPKVVTDIAFAGSHSTESGTWMWSWGNSSLPDAVRESMAPVREFGERMNFMKVAAGYWRADEQDGWLMAAFAMHVLGGIGAYRTPMENGYSYMVILNAGWAQ